MAQIDALDASTLESLEETVRVVRALLSGELINAPGNRIALRDVQLAHPPEVVPPVLIGSTGKRGLRLADRIADGIVLPEVSSPAAVEWARSLAGGASRTVVYAMLSIDDDSSQALLAARDAVERWATSGLFAQLTEVAGIGTHAQKPISDGLLRSMTVAGTPTDCADAIHRWAESGVDDLVLLARDPDGDEQVERFASQVLRTLVQHESTRG
jgi:alkanesulfonate monooxygenase SsuD/methylene tetrahydromethanopterin reductase-like flavin-dependent oxidoreductase (luciferase family)